MSYYRKKVYDSHNGASKLNARTGQVVRTVEILEKMIQPTAIQCRSAPAE